MIGVIAESADHEVVCEFFELFKTPWEFYREGREYPVILCTDSLPSEAAAQCIVVYAGQEGGHRADGTITFGISPRGDRIPIYGRSAEFPATDGRLLIDEGTRRSIAHLERRAGSTIARIGYDLFGEVRALLTVGQPAENAAIPALDLHIAFLRDLITGCGVELREIPPVPDGYQFIACLTHDVDHPLIRRHKCDHTTLGFLYRAIFSSLRDVTRGWLSIGNLLRNWSAALKLPLVHLGLVRDFWSDFADRYRELEGDAPSTFFVIPFANRPGKTLHGPAPEFRGARYGARDIANSIQKVVHADCEVGLHGIDAWIDSSKGAEEFAEIERLSGESGLGVRMHWLYFDRQSPATLEKAGAAYDSTVGYNQTVGFRAGTTQVYKLLGTEGLLELPLHIMDTALFYPAHLGLSKPEARSRMRQLVDQAVRLGGCLAINWHDRSTAPERLWGDCYRELVEELRDRGAWFATAGQAVSWFRERRSARFENERLVPKAKGVPRLQWRVQREQKTECAAAGPIK